MITRALVLFGFCFLIFPMAWAQPVPTHLYNGIALPFEVDVKSKRGKIELAILEAGTAKELDRKPAKRGKQNLFEVFPSLASTKKASVVYIQIIVNGKASESALVLQPMTNPTVATISADGKGAKFSPDEDQAFAGYRAWVDTNVIFETSMGDIEFRMRPDCAPNSTWNFIELVKGGFYREIIFHRVVAKRADGTPFVIQAGDPTGTGNGGPGYAIALEDSLLPHDLGVISYARSTDPNTAGSQIFVCLSRDGTKHLDHRYAAFGQTIRGLEVVKAIGAVPVGPQDRPTNPPVILRAVLSKAGPYVKAN